MRTGSLVSATFGAVAVLSVAQISGGTALARDETTVCQAVQNEASLTRPDKLVFSMASNSVKKFCHFFVSMPPPFASKNSVELWYRSKASTDQAKELVSAIIDIALAPIPNDDPASKEVALRIGDNAGLITACITSLFKQGPFDAKSKDGSLECTVPSSAERLVLTVALGDVFKSSITLPRPV